MKFIIITALKEYQQDVVKLLKQCNVGIFSITNVAGFKQMNDENLLDDWFAISDDSIDSIFAFCFTQASKIDTCKTAIETFNKQHSLEYPIRAFFLNVEDFV